MSQDNDRLSGQPDPSKGPTSITELQASMELLEQALNFCLAALFWPSAARKFW